MTTIAVVTAITFGGNLQTCFEAGLNASAGHSVTIPHVFEAKGDYGVLTLQTLVQYAASTKPDLIVTAGGLPAAMAAANTLDPQTDPQFVYLSGILLNTTNTCNSGGVNQNVPMQNQARKSTLTGRVADPTRIWLVVNNNNTIFSNAEIAAWGKASVQEFFQGSPTNPPTNTNDNTNNNHFIQEFQALASMATPPLGLVISPDPYFRHWRTAFTIALDDQLPVPVCYPYHEFVDAAAPTGNHGNSISLDEPALARGAGPTPLTDTAYYQLGLKAGQFLTAKASGHPKQFVGVTTWNGTQWQ
jgi:hypothetical protein